MGFFLESATSEALCVVALLASILYYFATSTFEYWKNKGVAYLKPIPFFGNTVQMTTFQKSPSEIFKGFYFSKEFKNEKFGGIYLGRRPALLVKDPDVIKQIMIKDFSSFSDRGLVFNEEKDPLSAHLFNLGGWRWRALRMKLTPTFTSGKMKMMYGVMAECAEGLEKMLEQSAKNEEELEIKEPLAKFTTDVIGTCAFGLQFNSMSNPDSEFRQMGRKIFTPSLISGIKRNITALLPFLSKFFGISFLSSEVSSFFLRVVGETVSYREKNNVTRNDFMQLLIDIKNKGAVVDDEEKITTVTNKPTDDSGKQVLELTDTLLAAQAFIFFLAGFETSSTTMSFALYELALNPDVQEKLAEEVRETVSNNGGKLSYDLLQSMKYLDMVIAETLRKYPPVGNLFRTATKTCKIEGTDVVLEAACRIFIPVYAIHRDPQYYPDPEKFDPERFTTEEKAKRHPMVYLPFGEGPRNCIGARFGLLQTKLGLATLLRRYAFEVSERTPIPAKLDPRAFVTTLKGGVWLKMKERSS